MSLLTKPQAKTFTVVALILLVGVFAVILSTLNWQQSVYEGWGQWLFYSMYLYLVFIFFRTAIHLMLCFASTFFDGVRKVTLRSHIQGYALTLVLAS